MKILKQNTMKAAAEAVFASRRRLDDDEFDDDDLPPSNVVDEPAVTRKLLSAKRCFIGILAFQERNFIRIRGKRSEKVWKSYTFFFDYLIAISYNSMVNGRLLLQYRSLFMA